MNDRNFWCDDCEMGFDDVGKKVEWKDPVFGASWKMLAACPNCSKEADEKKAEIITKGSNDQSNEAPSCATGMCPYASG